MKLVLSEISFSGAWHGPSASDIEIVPCEEPPPPGIRPDTSMLILRCGEVRTSTEVIRSKTVTGVLLDEAELRALSEAFKIEADRIARRKVK